MSGGPVIALYVSGDESQVIRKGRILGTNHAIGCRGIYKMKDVQGMYYSPWRIITLSDRNLYEFKPEELGSL